MRHVAVRRAFPGKPPKIHALGMLRAPKSKKLFWSGSALGVLGLPPLAVGSTRIAHGSTVDKAAKPRTPQERADRLVQGARRAHLYGVQQAQAGNIAGVRRANRLRNARAGRSALWMSGVLKADQKRGFWREGLSGTREALGERASSYREPVPTKVRAAQAGVGVGAGALGSLAARAALGRRGNALKPLLTPVAGGLAATASVPLTNRYLTHRHSDYVVTPAGVRRRKKDPVKPSKYSSQHRPMPRSLHQDMAKADEQKMPHPSDAEMWRHLEEHHALHWKTERELSNRGWGRAEWREYHEGSHASGLDAMRSELKHTHPRLRIVKADSYQGARTPYMRQRAAITAAGHPPVIGPFTQAAAAARYAPPGQERKEALRQYGMASAAGIPIGVGGAYAGAHLAQHSRTAERAATGAMQAKKTVHNTARRAVGLGEKTHKGPGKLALRVLESKAGKPFRTKAGAAGGAAGFLGAKMASGAVLGQAAITMNQNDQRRYNKLHHIEKGSTAPPTRREKHQLANRKRRSAALATISGSAGLGSLVLLAARKRNPAVTLGTIGAGVGGTNSLLGAQVQRQEASAVDPVKKRDYSAFWAAHRAARKLAVPKPRVVHLRLDNGKYACGAKHVASMSPTTFTARPYGLRGGDGPAIPMRGMRRNAEPTSSSKYVHNVTCATCKGTQEGLSQSAETTRHLERTRAQEAARASAEAQRERRTGQHRALQAIQRNLNVQKAAALAIEGSKHEHAEMLRRYGDRGPLPKNLSREERMKAYEARYVHHGGDKANKWSRRAGLGTGLKNAGLAVGTAGGAGWLATRGKRGARLLAKHPALRSHAETTAVAGATVGGVGEMLAGYAHRRQSSYTNSPGGVAASALRRMRAYTPEGT